MKFSPGTKPLPSITRGSTAGEKDWPRINADEEDDGRGSIQKPSETVSQRCAPINRNKPKISFSLRCLFFFFCGSSLFFFDPLKPAFTNPLSPAAIFTSPPKPPRQHLLHHPDPQP